MATSQFTFGHIPDSPDPRDYKFVASLSAVADSIDLRELCPPIRHQGKLSSCTAFATTAMVEMVRNKQTLKPFTTSPLFTYYATRKIENNVDQDNGAMVRDALKSVVDAGVTEEAVWPYDAANYAVNPPVSAWESAETHQALVYRSVSQTADDVLGCLSEGYAMTFGALLYESFMKTQTGFFIEDVVPMPNTSKEKYVGAHCMLAVGYFKNNNTTCVIVRNSWGEYVGHGGYHSFPLDYLLNPALCFDFWTIRSEEFTPEELLPIEPLTPVVEPPAPVVDPPVIISPTPTPVIDQLDVVDAKPNIWRDPTTYILIAFGILFVFFFIL